MTAAQLPHPLPRPVTTQHAALTFMTSRELADEIVRLVDLKIAKAQAGYGMDDDIEVVTRRIADGLRRLDHTPGVYFDPGAGK